MFTLLLENARKSHVTANVAYGKAALIRDRIYRWDTTAMLPTLLAAIFLSPLLPCEASITLLPEYRLSYVPEVIDIGDGLQIVPPDSPYVAAAGRKQLYFLDTRLDVDSARHAKEQLERALLSKRGEFISIDEVEGTAAVKSSLTGETTFVFDTKYARILFARGINKRNPGLKLPKPEPAGDWLVTYDLEPIFTMSR